MSVPASDKYQPAAIVDESNEMSVVIERPVSPQPQPCDEWLSSIMNEGGGESSNNTMPKHKIQKVPQILRQMETESESTKKCFDPHLVSIGPFHHKNTKLKSFNKFKIHFTREYVKSCVPTTSITELYNEVAKMAAEARSCYAGRATKGINEPAFTQMMFLDGCFILQYIHYICTKDEKEQAKMKMKNHDIVFVQRDLFLLENQIPFKVLQALMRKNSNFVGDKGIDLIKEFIRKTRPSPPDQNSFLEVVENFVIFIRNITKQKINQQAGSAGSNSPSHLLELMHWQLTKPNAFSTATENRGEGGGSSCRNSQSQSPLKKLIEQLLNFFCSKEKSSWYSYRSVQELKTAGITFRPNKKTSFVTDVRYEPLIITAILRLPPMTIDDSTQSLLLNLVAYEMCPDTPNVFEVSSYIWFMDTLIDQADDVKELRKKGILLNYLGSDEEVAGLFNRIANNLVPNPHAYEDVKNKIEKHYKDKVILWMTEGLHTHFSTPWTILAFLGAILAIVLSLIQTYYTVHPNSGN